MSKLTISEIHALNSGKASEELKAKAKKLAEEAAKKPVAAKPVAAKPEKKGEAKK